MVGINPLNSQIIKNSLTTLDLGKLLLFFFNVRYIIPSQSVWIKRDFLIQNELDILDESLNYCMDLEWYCRISLYNPYTFKIKKPYSFFRLSGNTKTILNAKAMKEESLLVAQKYLFNLKNNQLKNWHRYKLLDRILRKIYAKKLKCNFTVLAWILKKTGFISIFDKRILGLFKLEIKNEIRNITSN